MKLKWLGHSCFLLTSADGTRILTDPYDETVGYPPLQAEADIVTVSHGHFDHGSTGSVKGSFVTVSTPGKHHVGEIEIIGIETFHDEDRGKKRGNNIVFKFNVDGMNICHCGDLGHLPDTRKVAEIGKIDILLIPVGGTYTVDAKGACNVIDLIKPTVAIPMHYRNDYCKFPITTVERFIETAGTGTYSHRQEIEVTPENLAEYPGILVLEYRK